MDFFSFDQGPSSGVWMKWIISTALFFYFVISLILGAENTVESFTSEIIKNELELLYADVVANASNLIIHANISESRSWEFDIYLMKQYMIGHEVLLAGTIDDMLYRLICRVLKLSMPVSSDIINNLIENKYEVTIGLINKMKIRARIFRFKAACIPEWSQKWLITLVDLQDRTIAEILDRLSLGKLKESQESYNLVKHFNILREFHRFYSEHEVTRNGIHIAIHEVEELFTLSQKDCFGFQECPFRPYSFLTAFFISYKPISDVQPPSLSFYNSFLTARKNFGRFLACYHYIEHPFDMRRFEAIISYVFPTFEEKLGQLREVLEIAKSKLCSESAFSNTKWANKATINSLIASSLGFLEHGPTVIKTLLSIADASSAAVYFFICSGHSYRIKNIRGNLIITLDVKNIESRLDYLRDQERHLFQAYFESADNKYWIPVVMEILALCNSAMEQFVVDAGGSIIFEEAVLVKMFQEIHGMASVGSLRNVTGETFFKKVDDLCVKRLGGKAKEVPKTVTVIPPEDLEAVVAAIEGPKPKENSIKRPSFNIKKEVIEWNGSANSDSDSGNEDADEETSEVEVTREAKDGVTVGEDVDHNVNSNSLSLSIPKPTSLPIHIQTLIEHEDADLLRAFDCRDIAYGYLMIGNEVYIRYISPLIRFLEYRDLQLNQVFLRSLSDFESEVKFVEMMKPNLIEEGFKENGIEDLDFFMQCIRFYGKRLRVAHQFIPCEQESRVFVAKLHLSALYQSKHSFFGHGSELVNENAVQFGLQSTSNLFTIEPFTTKMRCGFVSEDDISYELSILGLAALFKSIADGTKSGGQGKVRLGEMRAAIAHHRPDQALLSCIINGIFINTRHHEFLRKLLL